MKLSIRLKDEFEKSRLEALSGENTLTEFLLGLAFHTKSKKGDDTTYPGWDVIERNRRDGGIKISKDPAPLGRKSPTVLYSEDKEYKNYA